jgi:hypothetical protein
MQESKAAQGSGGGGQNEAARQADPPVVSPAQQPLAHWALVVHCSAQAVVMPSLTQVEPAQHEAERQL